jgi:hypothetical protein
MHLYCFLSLRHIVSQERRVCGSRGSEGGGPTLYTPWPPHTPHRVDIHVVENGQLQIPRHGHIRLHPHHAKSSTRGVATGLGATNEFGGGLDVKQKEADAASCNVYCVLA